MNIIQQNMENKTIYDFGYLEIVIGPMFSGKTSKILDIYKQCKFCNIDVMVINHSFDTRYDNVMLFHFFK
jgi:thymidine kinase